MIAVHVDKLKKYLGEVPNSWLKGVDCPTLSKIYERVINERVIELITSHETFPNEVPSSLETDEPVINNEVELEFLFVCCCCLTAHQRYLGH